MALIAMLVMLVGFAAILAHDLTESRVQLFESVRRDSDNLTQVLERQILTAVEKIDIVLSHNAQMLVPALSGRFPADRLSINRGLAHWMAFIPEAQSQSLRVADAEGRIVYNAGETADVPDVVIQDRGYFRRQREDADAGLVISEPLLSRFTGAWLITLSRRVTDEEGVFIGVAQAALRAEYFEALFSRLDIGEKGVVALFDADMRLLARKPATPERLGQTFPFNPIRPALDAGQIAGSYRLESRIDGIDRLFVFRKLERLPYVLVIGRAPSEFMAGWSRKSILYGVGFLGMSLALLSFLFLYQRHTEENRHLVNQVFMTSREGIVVTDTAGRIVTANPGFTRITGYDLAEVVGQTSAILASGRHDPAFFQAMWRDLAENGTWTGEVWNRRRSGEIYPQRLSIDSLRGRRGEVTHYIGVFSDISETHRIHAEVEESRRRLEEAQRLAGLGSWEFEPGTGRLFWSETTFAIFGRDPVGVAPSFAAFEDSIHPADRAAYSEAKRTLESKGEAELAFRIIRPDGAVRHVLSRARVIAEEPDSPVRISGAVLDVSDREKANADLGLFRRIIDATDQGVGIADAEGRVLFLNRALAQMTEHDPLAVRGRHYSDFLADTAGESARGIAAAYAMGRNWLGRIDILRADGTTFTALNNTGCVLDSNGHPQYLFSILSDLSVEIAHQDELRAALAAAEQASRAKSAFLANMSHELRTPLNAILGFSEFIEMDGDLPLRHREGLAAILKAGRHLLELINQILDLARIEAGRDDLFIESVEIAPVVAECLGLMSPLARARGLTLEFAPLRPGLSVYADRTRLRQILVNLLSNAVKYNRPNGVVSVSAEPWGGGMVRIGVADTGPGIAPERMADLFTPFNRLGAETANAEGTGIGLALTLRLVEAMDGRIRVDSRPGQGCTFWVDLSAADESEVFSDPVFDGSPPPSHG